MTHSLTRRGLLVAAASLPLTACSSWPTYPRDEAWVRERLAALETSTGGRLGVAALNTADGRHWRHRANERFAMCSTFKVIAAAAILARSTHDAGLLQQRISYRQSDLVTYSPITQQHVGTGMTVAELCAAALQYSDNTAGNLLMRWLGGPAAVTAFARAIGDAEFRLDRWETELNTAIPGDPRDTTTPASMATDLQRLALGNALPRAERDRLVRWMRGNTTGGARIRAGVPADWQVADKTGSGDYGSANDIAIVWPPARPPIVIAVFFTEAEQDAKPRSDVLAAAARIIMQAID